MNIPLLDDGSVDIDALLDQVDGDHLSAFESLVLSGQETSLPELIQEVKENPSLAKLAWREGETILCGAAHDNQPELVSLLIGYGADVNASCKLGTAIFCAVWGGNPSIVDLLIKSGAVASIDIGCDFGWSPLHLAARKGYADIVEQLLEAGAAVNTTDDDGYTPLDLAAQWKRADVVPQLLERDAPHTAKSTGKYIASLGEPG